MAGNNPALKFDDGKVPMDLLDPDWLEGTARVLQFGAGKYDKHNWRKGVEWSRLYAAAQRHLNAFARGWETDDETGLSHLLHASCCLMFLYEMQQNRRDLNDMYWADRCQDPQSGAEADEEGQEECGFGDLLRLFFELVEERRETQQR